MDPRRKPPGGLVYSTQHGQICPACRLPVTACACRRPQTSGRAGDGTVRVARETKGRKGAGVTLITGLALPENELRELARRLKRLCGAGGTVRDGTVEIQGDQRDAIVRELAARGWKVKRAGE